MTVCVCARVFMCACVYVCVLVSVSVSVSVSFCELAETLLARRMRIITDPCEPHSEESSGQLLDIGEDELQVEAGWEEQELHWTLLWPQALHHHPPASQMACHSAKDEPRAPEQSAAPVDDLVQH